MAFAGDDELAALRDVQAASYILNAPPELGRAASLPESVLDLLFLLVDTPTFASLALLNKHWRSHASQPRYYAYHLASSTFPNRPLKEKWETYEQADLPLLKREFIQAAKLYLYPVYRPRLSTFHIVAPAVLSSTSAPHGEFFSYSFSPRATHLAVYTACRLFVLDLQSGAPQIQHALSIRQRPLAVEVSDGGSRLALLISELKIRVYTLHDGKLLQTHAFLMDEPARVLALSPDATLLAAAQGKAVELFALSTVPGRVPRRVVACDSVSHLSFSSSGKFLLGSHTRSSKASTTIINAPDDMNMGIGEDDGDDAPTEDTATMWISRPLFPAAYERTTHATLLPGDEGTVLAYDEPADSFGILDAQAMSFAHTLLTVPVDFLQPSSLPSINSQGDLAAIPFSRSGIRIFNIRELPSEDNEDDSSIFQRWVPFTKAISRTRWQARVGYPQRLVSVSAGKSTHPELVNDNPDEQQETGSIFIFDFDCHADATKARDVIIDLSRCDVLPLESVGDEDDAIQVQKRPASRASDRPINVPLARSVTAARRKRKAQASTVPEEGPSDRVVTEETNDAVAAPEQQHFEEIYHPSLPRPQASLIRSATTIAANRERQPPRFLANEEPRLRQAGDPSEIPDESDADNWVPPPPAYNLDEESRRQVRGERLPPVPPERSPNRLRLSLSTSTPDLQEAKGGPSQASTSAAPASSKPNKLLRPSPKRVKSAYENARHSIAISTQSARRVLTKPMTGESRQSRQGRDFLPERPPPVPPKDPEPPRVEASRSVSQPIRRRPVSVAVPQQTVTRPTSSATVQAPLKEEATPKRRSVIQRPLSFASSGFLESRPGNRRSVSLPVSTSLHEFPTPGSPDSPSIPSPAQMASLHRRQTSSPKTSSSIPSATTSVNGPPRAAIGAIRAGTNPNSPWASSTMLAPLSEDGVAQGVLEESAPPVRINGRPVSGIYGQAATKTGATPPRRLQEARASLNSSGEVSHTRGDSYSSTDMPASSTPQHDEPATSSSRRPPSRLTTIQSVASAIKERSQSRGSPASGAVNRSGSVQKSTPAGAGTRKKSKNFFGRLKARLFGTLESV